MRQHIRRGADRGRSNHGWLDSRHTFSFADYYDTTYMGFGPLRVINEDRVTAGMGFGTHPHRNMEIISYVVDGALAHRDTLGTGSTIRPGEIQLMSAGRGIAHSEMNGSETDPVHFLQIWIIPEEGGTDPGYQQQVIPDGGPLTLLVSNDGRDGSLRMRQDADLWRVRLPKDGTAEHPIARKRVWVQVVRGSLDVDGAELSAGDGLALDQAEAVHLRATDDAEALLFDLA